MPNKHKFIKQLLSVMLVITTIFMFCPVEDSYAKVAINSTKKTIFVGKSTTLKVSGTKKKVTWSSSNKKIATVTSKGKVTGKKAGTATITAKVGKSKYKCKVIVKKKTVSTTQTSIDQTTTQQTPTISNEKVVCINPGHQAAGDSSKEANGPNSTTMKAKVTTGATGVSSRVAESAINLAVGSKLKAELEARGYTVIMTRESQDVNISNKQRAEIGNQASVTISLHCDSTTNASTTGAHTICINKGNALYDASYKLATNVINSYCSATGISSRGVAARSDLTGLNWSSVPAIYIEMGFLSNSTEDQKLSNDQFQNMMATGIANGIDAYFNS